MSRLVSRAESWESVYAAFSNINFAAFDYNTVKQSILDYVKLYFPETFNDFIESSEFIAIVESFAYMAELLAYRIDIAAHENFISTAQRRDSILKLAKLVSYKASRPLPARGLVKITSVSTTETLIDSNGVNLSGRTIRWNDTANTTWKDQFILVMNRVLDQEFGSVIATDRFQIQDVLFEIYPTVTTVGVMPYTATVYGQSVNMELVPVTKYVGDAFVGSAVGITERRPQTNAQFTMLYGSDGLGDASETTGFFCYTKQGSLQRFQYTFDGITPNMTYDVPVSNVNDTDVWVNNVDSTTGDIIVKTTNLPYRKETLEGKYGEWVEVDVAHAQNVIFNTNPKRNKYEVETTGNNQVRLLFGDGEFADIPFGTFDIWVRSSENSDLVVPQSSIVDVPISFSYLDTYNQTQTFSFTVTLINSLQNASAAETTEHIRETAPAVYYTQDRMVNGEDYNTYMRQNPTILKLRAVNRTFAGDSKYITWHDSSNTYENVKIFGDDGLIYIQDSDASTTTPSVETNVLISTYVEPLLISTDVFMQLITAGVPHTKIRRVLNGAEKARLTDALTIPPPLRSVDMYYNMFSNEWYSVKTSVDLVQQLTFGGYQTINFNGYITDSSKAITYPVATLNTKAHLVATFVINGGATFGVSVSTATPPTTFANLVALVNNAFTTQNVPAQAYIENGNIVVRSTAIAGNATQSSVVIVDGDGTDTSAGKLFGDIIISTSVDSVVTLETAVGGYAYPTNFIPQSLIAIRQVNENDQRFTVSRTARRIVFESATTSFWNTNTADRVMDYDTLRSSFDVITLLQANTNCNRTGVLKRSWKYNILGQELVESGDDTGIADIRRVSIISTDENADNVPDYLNLNDADNYMGIADIINPKLHATVVPTNPSSMTIVLPVQYISGFGDVTVVATDLSGAVVDLKAPKYNIPNSTTDQISSQATADFGPQIVDQTAACWYEVGESGDYLNYGMVSNAIKFANITVTLNITVYVNEYVYFNRQSISDNWAAVEGTSENMMRYVTDYASYHYEQTPPLVEDTSTVYTLARESIQQQYIFRRLWKRHIGRDKMNFAWMHFSPRYQLVDPSPTNIIDIFVITRGYFISYKRWLEDPLATMPDEPTPLDLRNDYSKLLSAKMASDTVILHPGKFKLIIGDKSAPSLQSRLKVIRAANSTMTDNQIKNQIVATVRNFFDVATFEFGETFYFTELASAIHMDLSTEVSSVVMVPTMATSQFGDLLQVFAREDEIIYPDIGVEDIDIVSGFTPTNLRVNG